MGRIQRALISVSDKTGLVDFAKELQALGVEIISTGGTARTLKDVGISVVEISEFTGFPEMLDGRVKTLHPKVHGGLLYIRGNAEHEAEAARQGIKPIDLVVVNLYPFEKTVAKPGVLLNEAIENIDIGGPSMLRSAAKNHASVTVVVDPADYPAVLKDIKEHGGDTCEMFRWKLAVKVFETTARYDGAIAQYLHAERMRSKADTGKGKSELPETLQLSLKKAQDLRYGENPHQQAALYGDFFEHFQQLRGKELSYNNILDLTAAAELATEFEEPTVAIIKHTNPCGVGSAATSLEAWDLAYATDKLAPFGGIIAVNRPLDATIASAIAEIFSEVIVAPEFEPGALAILQKKKNLRLIKRLRPSAAGLALRSVAGGVLAQERDTRLVSAVDMKVVTKRHPTHEERHAILFAWRVVKHVKSNAIVFTRFDARGSRTLGIGAGQMSRVDSSKIAVWKAREAGLDLNGSVVASDAFFPFPDGVIAAAEAGATAVIQPGGSVRDAEVIAAADERNMAMVFTGIGTSGTRTIQGTIMDRAPTRAKILVVDDEEPLREYESNLLAELGHEVLAAGNGTEAVRVAREQQPDLLLLDIMMPEMSGIEVCQQLRADPRTRHIRIIVVSGLDSKRALEESIIAGADDFLAKPIHALELMVRVRSILRVRHIVDEEKRLEAYVKNLQAMRRVEQPVI